MIVFYLFVILVGGGWFVSKIVGNNLFPKNNNDALRELTNQYFYNYITENHLYITMEDIKNFEDKY